MIGCGTPLGANRPAQIDERTSGMPLSISVGQDLSTKLRSAVVTARTRTRPDLMCGIAEPSAALPAGTSPPAVAVIAGAPPL